MQLAALKHRTESEDCSVIDHSHVKIRLHTAKGDVKRLLFIILITIYHQLMRQLLK